MRISDWSSDVCSSDLVGARDVAPGEDLRHAGVDAPLDHQVVGLARLQKVGEVAALDALLAHPHEARVEGDVVAGGAGAEHHNAAAIHHEAAHREGLIARLIAHEVIEIGRASCWERGWQYG